MSEEKIPGFPCYRYHLNNEPTIFRTQAELDAAGDGWVDNPDKVGKQAEEIVLPETPEQKLSALNHAQSKIPKLNLAEEVSPVDEVSTETPEPEDEPIQLSGEEYLDNLRARARELGIKGNLKVWKQATLVRKINQALTETEEIKDE